MPDFTSALYLGMEHPSSQIPAFSRLTTGRPSLLQEPRMAQEVAQKIARLQGLKAGVLGTSTLHLFWDLFGMMGGKPSVIFFDMQLYEVPKWGLLQAHLKGIPVIGFPHFDVLGLKKKLKLSKFKQRKPILVTDGFCPQCGRPAPLKKYAQLLQSKGGILVVDDTQALGLLGKRPTTQMPFGQNGGGILPFLKMDHPNIIAVSSLAKGFGVPVAVLASSQKNVDFFKRKSLTRLHCSPPSFATIHALQKALTINQINGNQIRKTLFQKIYFFKKGISNLGLKTVTGYFPVQTIIGLPNALNIALYQYLKRRGFASLLLKSHIQNQAAISFIITNAHSINDLKKCLANIQRWMNSLDLLPR